VVWAVSLSTEDLFTQGLTSTFRIHRFSGFRRGFTPPLLPKSTLPRNRERHQKIHDWGFTRKQSFHFLKAPPEYKGPTPGLPSPLAVASGEGRPGVGLLIKRTLCCSTKIDFVENQLSPGPISFSLLLTAHPMLLQQQRVRPATSF
jgi:hypothetical protein